MTILNQIYGGACPKWPTNIYVTNFTKKRTHLGTHSYVTPGNDGKFLSYIINLRFIYSSIMYHIFARASFLSSKI